MAWPRRAAIVAEARAVRPAGPAVPGDPRAGTTAARTGGRAVPAWRRTVAVARPASRDGRPSSGRPGSSSDVA